MTVFNDYSADDALYQRRVDAQMIIEDVNDANDERRTLAVPQTRLPYGLCERDILILLTAHAKGIKSICNERLTGNEQPMTIAGLRELSGDIAELVALLGKAIEADTERHEAAAQSLLAEADRADAERLDRAGMSKVTRQ